MVNNKISARITFIGDLLCPSDLIKSAYNSETKRYNFASLYNKISKYFTESDYVIGNLETPLAGKEVEYATDDVATGFNAPEEYLEALLTAGVDAFTTGNNHCFDRGEEGLINTLNTLEERHVDYIGTYMSNDERAKILIKNINGISVAFLNYTFGINYCVHDKMIPKNKAYMVNLLTPPELHNHELIWNSFPKILNIKIPKFIRKALTKTSEEFNYGELTSIIDEDIRRAREQGAEFIVLLPHIGIEHLTSPSKFHRQWVERFVKKGVDLIVCTHPHVLQPLELWRKPENNGSSLVAYSLGNFGTSNLEQYWKSPHNLSSIILNIDLVRNPDTEKIEIKEISYTPTWIHHEVDESENLHVEVMSFHDAIKGFERPDTHLSDIKDLERIYSEVQNILVGNQASTEIVERYVVNPDTILHGVRELNQADKILLKKIPKRTVINLLLPIWKVIKPTITRYPSLENFIYKFTR